MIQGSDQTATCAYVFNELPLVYTKVCESKARQLPIENKKDKASKSKVKCDECNYRSSLVQMKLHIKNMHSKKTRKRPSVLTPLPNPAKRVQPSVRMPSNVTQSLSYETMNMLLQSINDGHIDTSNSNVEVVEAISSVIISPKPENRSFVDHKTTSNNKSDSQETYACDECGISFTSKPNFEEHLTITHETAHQTPRVVLFPCKLCDFHATSEIVMSDHMSSSHKNLNKKGTLSSRKLVSLLANFR